MHILSTFLDSKEVERIGKSFFLFCEKIFPSFLYPRKIIFATKMSKEKTKDPQKISLEKMGLRSAKAVALHILQENTHESNFVPDISNAPYLRGNLGRTHLAPIPGFPPFCDDMYVYGRLGEKDAVWVGNQVRCTSGTNGSASLFVSRISNLCQEVWPRAEYKYIHVSLVHTVRLGSGGKICETIAGIEKDSNGKLERQWRKLYGNPVAFFLSKLDVSEVPLPQLLGGLPRFQQLLAANCMGLYQLDCTQDFSGTLDRSKLVEHLVENHNFFQQGNIPSEDSQGCILDNTNSVGNHVCTFCQTIGGRATTTKFYNKFVSQIEAGDVRSQFGGHMSGVVASTNEHLRQTLAHPDIVSRGCTRVEISIYGCTAEEFSPKNFEALLEEIVDLATPKGPGLFLVVPLHLLWKNYANCLDRCFVLADRCQGSIYVAWSGNSKTGRVQGVVVRPTSAMVRDSKSWNRAVEWTMADFALRRCPIFFSEICSEKDGVVEFSPLQCFSKDAPTILCAANRPCELHIDGPNLEEKMPPTPRLEWCWRSQKPQRIGVALPSCELVEVPIELEGRQLSKLSARNRLSRLEELEEANSRILRKEEMQEATQLWDSRQRDFERLVEATKQAWEEKEKKKELLQEIRDTNPWAEKVSDHVQKEVFVLALLHPKSGSKKVLLQDGEGDRFWVWCRAGLEEILENQAKAKVFERKENFFPKTTLFWIPFLPTDERPGLQIRIAPTKSFWTAEGKKIHWNPLEVLSTPNIQDLESLREILYNREMQELLQQRKGLEKEIEKTNPKLERGLAPKRQKDCCPALDMEPGYYTVLRYAETAAHGKRRTILYLSPRDDLGKCDPQNQKPVRGVFLQEEVEKLACPLEKLEGQRIVCHLGKEKTTRAKKKCRLAQLFVLENKEDSGISQFPRNIETKIFSRNTFWRCRTRCKVGFGVWAWKERKERKNCCFARYLERYVFFARYLERYVFFARYLERYVFCLVLCTLAGIVHGSRIGCQNGGSRFRFFTL